MPRIVCTERRSIWLVSQTRWIAATNQQTTYQSAVRRPGNHPANLETHPKAARPQSTAARTVGRSYGARMGEGAMFTNDTYNHRYALYAD